MKKGILLILAPLFTSTVQEPLSYSNYEETIIQLEPKALEPIIKEEDLVSALIHVESRGNDSAIGDRNLVGEEAVGALQIRPIMVREVNRILRIQKSDKRFALKDRYDRGKTIEMFYVWRDFHHKNSDYETIARNWNGGPRGYQKKSTERYWLKVQAELDGTEIR